MKLLDKLHDAVFEDDKPTQRPSPPVVPPIVPAAPVYTMGSALALTISDPTEIDALRIKVHPKSGPLVLFAATLKSLASYIPDESSRYHAAQEAVLAQGVAVPDVLSELSAAAERIDQEDGKFQTARAQKNEAEVSRREDDLKTMAQQLKSHEDAIQALISQRDSIATALTVEKAKIAERSERFAGAVSVLKNEYSDAAGKIRRYLMPGGTNQ